MKNQQHLIGVKTELVSKATKAIMELINQLNYFLDEWNRIFSEIPTNEEIQDALSVRNKRGVSLRMWLKVRYVQKHNLLSAGLDPIKSIEIGLVKVTWPYWFALESSLATIYGLMNELIERPGLSRGMYPGLISSLNDLRNGDSFEFPEALEDKIQKKYSFHTETKGQELVCDIVKRLVSALNDLNSSGAQIILAGTRLDSFISPVRTDISLGPLGGNPDYKVLLYEIKPSIFTSPNSNLPSIVAKNLELAENE